MDHKDISEKENNLSQNDSSFGEDIKEIYKMFKNSSTCNSNFLEQEDNFKNILDSKFFEKIELEDVKDLLLLIEEGDINKKCKINNYYKKERHSYSKINTNSENGQHINECQEILSILKKPLRIKNKKNNKLYDIPFKSLKKPKKMSLEGKILYDNSLEITNGEIVNNDIKSINDNLSLKGN